MCFLYLYISFFYNVIGNEEQNKGLGIKVYINKVVFKKDKCIFHLFLQLYITCDEIITLIDKQMLHYSKSDLLVKLIYYYYYYCEKIVG